MKIIFKDIVNIYFYKKFNFIYSLLLFFIFYFEKKVYPNPQ